MLAGINALLLFVTTLLTLFFYMLSVKPAQLERKTGPGSYQRCKYYRWISAILMMLTMVYYGVYFFNPILPDIIPRYFPWRWIISIISGAVLLTVSIIIWIPSLVHAGKESLSPNKSHTMYQGIYKSIRHPQALSETIMCYSFGLFLNSPFLTLFAIIWTFCFIIMCLAEEKDLVIRYGDDYIDYLNKTGMYFPRIFW